MNIYAKKDKQNQIAGFVAFHKSIGQYSPYGTKPLQFVDMPQKEARFSVKTHIEKRWSA